MKVIVISQPKAGTYLCANLLTELGIKFTYMHINEDLYADYKNFEQSFFKTKNRPYVKSNLKDSLSLVKEGEFAVSHLRYNDNNLKLLKDFKKIILFRDWNSASASMKNYTENILGEPYNRVFHERKYKGVVGWKNEDDVFIMNFGDLIGKNYTIIDNLQEFLFNSKYRCSKESLNNALSKESLTKSNKRR